MKTQLILASLFLLLCQVAIAADLGSEAYCDYDKNKSEAERLLDQSPTLMVGMGRNSSATGSVLAVGVTESLSKFLQGSLSHKIGDTDCQLYRVTAEIQKHTTYDLQSIQLEQAQYRLLLTEEAFSKLDTLIQDEKVRQTAGTSTLQNVAILEAARQTLVVAESGLKQQIALIVLPEIDNEQLSSLISLATMYNLEEQQELSKQTRLQSWDVSVTIGEGSNPNYPMLRSLPSETFATAQFTYSFGTSARTRTLDRAASSYASAQELAVTGPINLAHLLQGQITRARNEAAASIDAYATYDATITAQLNSVEDVDTTVARAFRIQLTISKINNDIELGSITRTKIIMDKYLGRNFQE